MHAYIVMSLLTGARTEELRALTWDHVDLLGRPDRDLALPPHVAVWRSVRTDGDTKTRRSRRTLALSATCVEALSDHRRMQFLHPRPISQGRVGSRLVFCTGTGSELDASHVRRAFRTVLGRVPGINAAEWTPRELRHSFVSLLSDSGMPLEEISRLVGHKSTVVTELVYRKQLRPVLQTGAVAMDGLFGGSKSDSHSISHSDQGR